MQIGIYDWRHAFNNSNYEKSRLIYGDRGTGRWAEYLIDLSEVDGQHYIAYQSFAPKEGPRITTPFSIENIFSNYQYVQRHVDETVIPERDYSIQYTETELADKRTLGELNKTETTQYDKVIARRQENKELKEEGKPTKRDLKQIQKGDWRCNWCRYKQVCYNSNNSECELSI